MSDQNLKVLVIGSGGREHTIAKECTKSPRVEQVIVTPGNGGISKEFTTFSVSVEDNEGLVALAQSEKIDLVVVGPEVPLCNGVVDALNAVGILAYGPDAAGARLEEQGIHQGLSG